MIAGGAALTALVWISPVQPATVPLNSPAAAEAATMTASMPVVVEPAEITRTSSPVVEASAVAAAPEAVALAEIEAQLAANEPLSPRLIADHLRNPSVTVRQAAREALRAVAERGTIPDIQLALDTTTDPQEATELQELIDYLQLPTLSELEEAGVPMNNPRIQRPGPGAPVRLQRVSAATSAPAASVPSQTQPAISTEALAQLQAENQRLKQENASLQALVTPLLTQ